MWVASPLAASGCRESSANISRRGKMTSTHSSTPHKIHRALRAIEALALQCGSPVPWRLAGAENHTQNRKLRGKMTSAHTAHDTPCGQSDRDACIGISVSRYISAAGFRGRKIELASDKSASGPIDSDLESKLSGLADVNRCGLGGDFFAKQICPSTVSPSGAFF